MLERKAKRIKKKQRKKCNYFLVKKEEMGRDLNSESYPPRAICSMKTMPLSYSGLKV